MIGYFEKEALLEGIRKIINSCIPNKTPPMDALNKVVDYIMFFPTADVVPSSEVAKEFTCFVGDPHKVDHCPYLDEIETAKTEVDELQAEIVELKKDRYCISPDGGIELLPRSDIDKIKSENERLEHILNSYVLQYGTVKDQQEVIDKAVAEVVREIFEELEQFFRTPIPEVSPVYIMRQREFVKFKKKYAGGTKGE